MAWINIKWTDKKIQDTISQWSDGRELTRADWEIFCNVYNFSLSEMDSIPYSIFYKSGEPRIQVSIIPDTLKLKDSFLYRSATIKFKGNQNTVIYNKNQDDEYEITAESGNIAILWLTDVGINVTAYYGYTYQGDCLLANGFMNPDPVTSQGNKITSSQGYVTYNGFRTLNQPVSGIGAAIPYREHQSFDSDGSGYQHFGFIKKDSKMTYIGYFSDVQDFSSGIFNSSNSSFIDANGDIHYGPFLIFEYNNQYTLQNDQVRWNWNDVENKWFITDTEGVAQPILLKKLDHSGNWYITDSKNKKTKIQDEAVIQYLTSNYVDWQELQVRIYPTNPDFVMGFTFKIEMPDFVEGKVDAAIPTPFEMVTTIESDTSEYDLMQIAQNLSLNTKKYYKTQWRTGKYTTSGYLKMWEQYTQQGWTGSSFNVTNPNETTELHIQLAKLSWRIKFINYLPDDYMFQYPEHGYEWYTFYNDGNYHVSYFDSGVPLAYDWLMTDFAKVNYLLNTTDNFLNTITLNTQDSPDLEPQTLSNSLSSVHVETSSSSNKRYGFFTLFTDEAPETISLVFAVKNLAGEDFTNPRNTN